MIPYDWLISGPKSGSAKARYGLQSIGENLL